jgi:hypothetical protein
VEYLSDADFAFINNWDTELTQYKLLRNQIVPITRSVISNGAQRLVSGCHDGGYWKEYETMSWVKDHLTLKI